MCPVRLQQPICSHKSMASLKTLCLKNIARHFDMLTERMPGEWERVMCPVIDDFIAVALKCGALSWQTLTRQLLPSQLLSQHITHLSLHSLPYLYDGELSKALQLCPNLTSLKLIRCPSLVRPQIISTTLLSLTIKETTPSTTVARPPLNPLIRCPSLLCLLMWRRHHLAIRACCPCRRP